MAGEQGFTMFLEISLISLQHSVKPFKEFFGAMITMDDNWNPIVFGHESHMLGTSNGSQNYGLLLVIFDAFSRQKGSTAIGKLNHHWGLNISGSLKGSIDRRCRSTIECRQSNSIVSAVFHQFHEVVASDNSRRDNIHETHIADLLVDLRFKVVVNGTSLLKVPM